MEYRKRKGMFFRHVITIPFIWLPLIAFILLDLLVEIYHRICFRLCNIPLVKRRNYIVIDRHKLSYLPWRQKLYCIYCGYANGLLHYASEVAGRTEKYWCGIKHKKDNKYMEPNHHKKFVKYGDKKEFNKKYNP